MSKTTNATVLMEQKQPPDSTQPTLWRSGFWSLFVTQFQGAFSDNVFKFLVTFLIIGAYCLRMAHYLKDTITGRIHVWTEHLSQMERMQDLGWHDPKYTDARKL